MKSSVFICVHLWLKPLPEGHHSEDEDENEEEDDAQISVSGRPAKNGCTEKLHLRPPPLF
jgi:hypothetical protein